MRNAARRLPADEPAAAKPALRLPEDTAAAVADAVKARIERIVNDTVMQELGSLRELMEEQFAGLMWNERQRRNPVHGALTKYLLYRSAAGQPKAALPDLAGCILTKLDEASNLGGVLDTVIRYKLPVHYVSTGQKVPENLYVATKKFLLKSAFCAPREDSPFVPHDDDLPAMLSALSTRTGNELHEVRFG
ncbi:hypothetical protein BMMON2_42150 [Burkholderia mallei]